MKTAQVAPLTDALLALEHAVVNKEARTVRVTKSTRAGKDGKKLICPRCGKATVVYHFSWSAGRCQGCASDVGKYEWIVADKLTAFVRKVQARVR